jgi:hypothetical protein
MIEGLAEVYAGIKEEYAPEVPPERNARAIQAQELIREPDTE